MRLIYYITFYVFSIAALANTDIIISNLSHFPTLSIADKEEILNNFYLADEIWVANDVEELKALVQYNEPKMVSEMFNAYIEQLPSLDGSFKAQERMSRGQFKVSIKIPKQILNHLSINTIAKAHKAMKKNNKVLPLIEKTFYNTDSFLDWAKANGLDQIELKKFTNITHIDKVRKMYTVPINSYIWGLLPYSERVSLTEDFYSEKRVAKQGLESFARINHDNKHKIINSITANPKERASRLRYINKLLRATIDGEINIPLQKLMSPFIRKHLNTYSVAHGPNCFNSGLCTNRGNNYDQKFTSQTEIVDELNKEYKPVKSTNKIAPGDLLVYLDSKSGQVEHVATYISDELVFTKNGWNMYNPYIFQTYDRVTEQVYYNQKDYKLMVARKKAPGSKPSNEFTASDNRQYYFDSNETNNPKRTLNFKNKTPAQFLDAISKKKNLTWKDKWVIRRAYYHYTENLKNIDLESISSLEKVLGETFRTFKQSKLGSGINCVLKGML